MPQDIKMKIFNFNVTPLGLILHIVTNLIVLRCCMAIVSYESVAEWKNEETCIFGRISALHCSNLVKGVFLDSESKPTIEFLYDVILLSK